MALTRTVSILVPGALALAALVVAATGARGWTPGGDRNAAQDPAAAVAFLTMEGGRADWWPGREGKGGFIAFDRPGKDGVFGLWRMAPDGSGPRPLTDGGDGGNKERAAALPRLNLGQPAVHPSGKWIALQAQKKEPGWFTGAVVTPGAGALNDIWIMTADAGRAWPLTNISGESVKDNTAAALHPLFSPDGRQIVWTERVGPGKGARGSWVIRLADFRVSLEGVPSLSNIRTLVPGQNFSAPVGHFYEAHDISPDGGRLLFSSDVRGGMEVYELDLASGRLRQLTDDARSWDAHAHYSPDGRHIAWASSRGLDYKGNRLEAEFWLMRTQGTAKQRLTFFHEKGHPHYMPGTAIAARSAWRPDGQALAGLVLRHEPGSTRQDEGALALVTIPPEMLDYNDPGSGESMSGNPFVGARNRELNP